MFISCGSSLKVSFSAAQARVTLLAVAANIAELEPLEQQWLFCVCVEGLEYIGELLGGDVDCAFSLPFSSPHPSLMMNVG